MMTSMFLLSAILLSLVFSEAAEPNPPTWPSSVVVFGPDSKDINATIAAAYAQNGGYDPTNHGQFSDLRFAFMFTPGDYDVDCPVGYYTQVLGLGTSPSDVNFISQKGVYSEEQDHSIGGALSTFWRSAENFKNSATYNWIVGTGMMWAVSQAAPLRRIEVTNDLLLFEYVPPIPAAGEASGGYFANVKVDGQVAPGSQQQWFARDSTVTKMEGGVWNMVYSGVDGAPPSHCGQANSYTPVTNVATTPNIAEKPYITIDDTGKYFLQIPYVKKNSHGVSFTEVTKTVGFENVYVTGVNDTAAIINAKLANGLHVVVSPGIYHLDEPLYLNVPGQVLLGLGLATLVSAKQNAVISVGDVDGVRVAGFLLQAGPPAGAIIASVLMQWGASGKFAGDPTNPGVFSDIFARVGGPDGIPSDPVAVDVMVHVQSGNVIGDNMWFWRADHAAGGKVTYDSNKVKHGLVVDGDDVIMYGLAVEHTLQDLTVWNGEGGRTYFYQSELPYCVTQAQFGTPGYAGYRVSPNVRTHGAWGVGVYSFFRDYNVTTESGIVAPAFLEASFVAPLTVYLNGNGGLNHVINDKGGASNAETAKVIRGQYVCQD